MKIADISSQEVSVILIMETFANAQMVHQTVTKLCMPVPVSNAQWMDMPTLSMKVWKLPLLVFLSSSKLDQPSSQLISEKLSTMHGKVSRELVHGSVSPSPLLSSLLKNSISENKCAWD